MRRILCVLALVTVASCGADGEPVRPGISTSTTIGPDGVRTNVGTSIIRGNMSVHVGGML